MKYTITFAILSPILIYLAGAFASASFNIAEWNSYMRGYMAFFMILAGAAGCFVGFEIDTRKIKP